VVQKKENDEGILDIQQREGSGGLKSETPIEMELVVIETINRTTGYVRRDHERDRTGSGCDK
jgi:hypothetical protein